MTPKTLQAATYVDLSRISYLIADRNNSKRQLLIRALRNFSANDIRETSSIGIALSLIIERKPELVFLGFAVEQPEKNILLEAFYRSLGSLSLNIPTIILCEGASADDAATAVAMGADSCITVPFSTATIEAHILKAMTAQSIAPAAAASDVWREEGSRQ